MLVYAVINDVPLIFAGYLKHRVVGSAIDTKFWHLLEDNRIVSHSYWSERRFGSAIAYVIVWRTRIINRPEEIIRTLAVENVRRLAELPRLLSATLGCHHLYGLFLYAYHITIQLSTSHITVPPINIWFLALGVDKHIYIYLLPAAYWRITYDRSTIVNERPCWAIAHSHAYLLALASICTEIQKILIRAILLLHLDGSRRPCIAFGPFHLVALYIEHCTLIGPSL